MKLGVCKKPPKKNNEKNRQNKEVIETKDFLHYPS